MFCLAEIPLRTCARKYGIMPVVHKLERRDHVHEMQILWFDELRLGLHSQPDWSAREIGDREEDVRSVWVKASESIDRRFP